MVMISAPRTPTSEFMVTTCPRVEVAALWFVEVGIDPLLVEENCTNEVEVFTKVAVLSLLTFATLATLARLKLALILLGNRLAVGLGAGEPTSVRAA